ncbi:MAG: hypothetical protein Q4B29_03155 [Candidatus Saccharibacteria bacterium]|nr:hypothetical protein [Candidatus Saccharibacteria bacterium]
MVKKNLLSVIALGAALFGGAMVAPATYAADEVTVCATGCTYADLASAVAGVDAGATIKLMGATPIPAQIAIKKDVVIDFNSQTVTSTAGAFDIQGGKTEFVGEGTLKSDSNATLVWAMKNGVEVGESVSFTLGEDITLDSAKGWGIAVWKDNDGREVVPVTLNIKGTIKAPGAGALTINGVNHEANVVNIGATADLSGGIGIYGAGNATWNIVEGAKITGVESALGIKAGTWNISGGEFKATGAFVDGVEGNNNGINASGAAIQIEENNAYAGQTVLNISGGKFTSENGRAIYEYLVEDDDTILKDLKITGGVFEGKEDIAVSDQLIEKADKLTGISGGEFNGEFAKELLAENTVFVTRDDGTIAVFEAGKGAPAPEEDEAGLGAPKTGALTTGETSAAQDIALTVLFGATMMAVILLGVAVKAKR